MKIANELLIQMYRKMLTIRRFEERVASDYQNGIITGAVHSYIGQEAVAVGVCTNLRTDDRIISTHRGHGHCIAKGANLRRMMAELHGRSTGYCKGKGGSMHIADFNIGMLGANGIVGGGLPIILGAAMAAQLENSDRLAVCFFGDGACHEGEFHEALNLASIWKLPVIFVCENNLYAFHTPARYAIPLDDIAQRAAAYAMPGIVVNGNDVVAVYRTTGEVVARTRVEGGPTLIECKTYRWHSHFESKSESDNRPTEEIKAWKRKCPIVRLRQIILRGGILSESELKEMDNQVIDEIEDAVGFALESPFPDPEDALDDVFSA